MEKETEWSGHISIFRGEDIKQWRGNEVTSITQHDWTQVTGCIPQIHEHPRMRGPITLVVLPLRVVVAV